MKIRITHRKWEDAIRIELHLSIIYNDGTFYVDEKYKERVNELAEDGFISILQ